MPNGYRDPLRGWGIGFPLPCPGLLDRFKIVVIGYLDLRWKHMGFQGHRLGETFDVSGILQYAWGMGVKAEADVILGSVPRPGCRDTGDHPTAMVLALLRVPSFAGG